jgi:pimeloyl-ACP methyl ester carboxylesterase
VVATRREAGLAYERHGTGTPVVFLHGLTFDRTSWRPIVDRAGDGIESVLVDLPGHGDTPGPPPPTLDALAEGIHQLVLALEIERPLLVGHSMSGALAFVYAARFPTCGVLDVDQGLDIQPFAALVRRMEPALRGDGFAQAFQPFEESIGVASLPEEIRGPIVTRRQVQQDTVLGYWQQIFQSDPAELQARIDETLALVDVPVLALFGRPLADEDRARLAQLPNARVEEWPGLGHMLHLAEPDRFADLLRAFVERCGLSPASAAGVVSAWPR